MPDFKIPSEHHLMIIALKGQPFPKFDKPETEKITRDAFIYLDSDEGDFAQCGRCWQFNAEKGRCCILGPDFEVDADDSCCLFVEGSWVEGQPLVERISPEDAGFVEREVRCENCEYGGTGECQLYKMLNEKFPDVFQLETSISAKACCNAQTPKQKVLDEDKEV